MKCSPCPFYKNEGCIKMREGQLGELEGDCLLRYLSNQLETLIELHQEEGDGDKWRDK